MLIMSIMSVFLGVPPEPPKLLLTLPALEDFFESHFDIVDIIEISLVNPKVLKTLVMLIVLVLGPHNY